MDRSSTLEVLDSLAQRLDAALALAPRARTARSGRRVAAPARVDAAVQEYLRGLGRDSKDLTGVLKRRSDLEE